MERAQVDFVPTGTEGSGAEDEGGCPRGASGVAEVKHKIKYQHRKDQGQNFLLLIYYLLHLT